MSAKTSTWHLVKLTFWNLSRFDVTIHLVSHSETLYRLKSLFQSPIFHGDKRISRITPLSRNGGWWNEIWQIYRFLWIFSYEFSEVSPSNDRKRRNTYKDVFRIYLRFINLLKKKAEVGVGAAFIQLTSCFAGSMGGSSCNEFWFKSFEGFDLKQG